MRILHALLVSFVVVLPALARGPAPRSEDEVVTVCFVGNALAERLQHHGWLETRLHARFPETRLRFRNLGFSADEVTVAQRTKGFGTQDEHLTRCRARVVVGVFGFNESFAAPEGLPQFRRDLEAWVRHVRTQDYAGLGEPPTILLVTSIPFEDLEHPSLPTAPSETSGSARRTA